MRMNLAATMMITITVMVKIIVVGSDSASLNIRSNRKKNKKAQRLFRMIKRRNFRGKLLQKRFKLSRLLL